MTTSKERGPLSAEFINTLAEETRLGKTVSTAVALAKSRLFDLSLPSSGFLRLGDDFYSNCYTGWFYVKEGDRILSVGRRIEGIPMYATDFPSLFRLEDKQARELHLRVQVGPLTLEEADRLKTKNAFAVNQHPLYRRLNMLSLEDYTGLARPYIDQFWQVLKALSDGGDSRRLAYHLRINLLRLVIFNKMGRIRHDEAVVQIGEQMSFIGVTVFPIGGGKCVIGYREPGNNKSMIYRTIPLSESYIHHFQRDSRRGESPMTKGELVALYHKFVNPKYNAFDR